MSLGIYMDEHVHSAITVGLKLRGVDVVTAQEDNRVSIPDIILLDRATALQRVIFSQDQDFLVEAQSRQSQGIYFTGVVFARQFRISIGVCIRDLEIIAKIGNLEEFTNCVQFLPL